ncbi:MAG: squalene--hopene cyclase [Alphaproteobacteria bacterium]|nr:MAG: squalene--hopene cyclase [Alphaproteobacteria bacterium]
MSFRDQEKFSDRKPEGEQRHPSASPDARAVAALNAAGLAARAGVEDDLDRLVDETRRALRALQREDGHWVFEFEADATIPAEYVLLRHFLGDIDDALEQRIARYLRTIQSEDGGWPLFYKGEPDLSATVKAYFALKLVGDDPQAPHMRRAREIVLARGGGAQCNVFTRIALALYGQVPWRAVPEMPVEIMLLPRWFPFHLSKVSYWSRTVIVPLLILMALKPRARNPRGVRIDELFLRSPDAERYPMNATGDAIGAFFVGLDALLRAAERRFPRGARRRAIDKAVEFILPRLNGEDGLGGIFPAMANAVMAFDALGWSRDDPAFVMARRAIDKLLIDRAPDVTYCQPCLSPVWDTCLAMHAMLEAGEDPDGPALRKATDWLLEREIHETAGDWIWRRPGLRPGGWAFQYRNDYYPDVDDTAVVVMALDRIGDPRCRPAIERATDWVLGMQSSNGGWGAFDAENEYYYLNHIPFADHGALLDQPTVDVSARCLSMLAQLGYRRDHPAVRRGLEFLRREQEPDGSWYGRWGVNYVYGTWSALCAFNACGEDMTAPHIRKAVAWLKARQRPDGGWGEDCATYWPEHRTLARASTASQTAWALLGLMAVGEVDSEAVRRGVRYLERSPREGAKWHEKWYTGIGFPRVFYLNYHGYSAYFPIWALARYRNLRATGRRWVRTGM